MPVEASSRCIRRCVKSCALMQVVVDASSVAAAIGCYVATKKMRRVVVFMCGRERLSHTSLITGTNNLRNPARKYCLKRGFFQLLIVNKHAVGRHGLRGQR